jgi:hypothetical protein
MDIIHAGNLFMLPVKKYLKSFGRIMSWPLSPKGLPLITSGRNKKVLVSKHGGEL